MDNLLKGNISISSGNLKKIVYVIIIVIPAKFVLNLIGEGNPVIFQIFWIPIFTGMTFGIGTY